MTKKRINNYVPLFFWLYERTRINNEILTSNKELKNEFLKAFPNYDITETNNYISSKIGKCLNLIYGYEVTRTKNKLKVFYNVELLPETPENKAIYINNKRWLKWTFMN